MKLTSMLLGAAVALALAPVAAVAQSSKDSAYCSALTTKYNTYVMTRGSRGAKLSPPSNIAEAMSKCQTSDASQAIPVLEKALKDAKIELPARS